jgi:hypothetical protein
MFALLPSLIYVSLLAVAPIVTPASPQDSQTAVSPFFRIQVVDDVSGRGVPLVELRMVDGTLFYTDSAGVVAFLEPGLMGKEVYFHVSSHGYEHEADFFGYRGVKLTPVAGGSANIQIKRLNIAERLYRITGVGIYRDSRILEEPVPIKRPFLNGQVAGQDTALMTPHNGKLYWFWGDTNRPSYPLGNFKTSGATSEYPVNGGLLPQEGIDLTYWVNAEGFSRAMAPVAGSGVVWLGGLQTVPDAQGTPRLTAHFTRLAGLGAPIEKGLVLWNENSEVFEKVSNLPLDNPLHASGAAPFKHTVNGVEYLYFSSPYPNLRVRAVLSALDNPAEFQGYTPMVAGSRFDGANTQLERNQQGDLVWAWKFDTPPLTPSQQRELVAANLMTRSESPFRIKDFDSGKPIAEHAGTVSWNAYRQKWIMLFGRSFGESSFLGDIYLAESKEIEGPWTRARKIISHNNYSFYNVAHRSFFDQDGGRIIYFEGTYTKTFSSAPFATPRYNYNQMMYRLDLSDPRLYQP